MMKILASLFVAILSGGCYSTMYYGYLPGGDYQYYTPLAPVDLAGERLNLVVVDNRHGFTISCWENRIDRNTELEGATGFDFFRAYVRGMIEANHGVFDPASDNVLTVELTGLSAEYQGYGFVRVYGLVEFTASYKSFRKEYCSVMSDGDPDAPLGKYSFATRKGALRKLVSGSTRRAVENLMHDIIEWEKSRRMQG